MATSVAAAQRIMSSSKAAMDILVYLTGVTTTTYVSYKLKDISSYLVCKPIIWVFMKYIDILILTCQYIQYIDEYTNIYTDAIKNQIFQREYRRTLFDENCDENSDTFVV